MSDPDPEATSQPGSSAARERGAQGGIDTSVVRRLAEILNDTGLTQIEVEQGGLKIRVAREVIAAAPALTSIAAPTVLPAQAPIAAAVSQAALDAPAPQRGELVKSPMVGTAYLQPQPGAKPFVEVGDRVSAGQTLLVVEAMKTLNPIPAPRAGVVLEILIEDAQPIEFGEPLVVIE